MSEFVKAFDIFQTDPSGNPDISGLAPGGTLERTITIPGGSTRWSLLIVPKDSGPGTAPTFVLEHNVGFAEFFPTNPPSTGTALKNTSNIVTREDVVHKVKVKLTFPATKIDGDCLVRLFIDRGGAA